MRVLLASDGSPDAMQAAEWTAASGLLDGASILVLSVVTPPGVPVLPASMPTGSRRMHGAPPSKLARLSE